MFKHLKIGLRLGLGFAVVLILTATVAGLAVNRLGALSDITRDIVDQRMHASSLAHDMIDLVNQNARDSLQLFLIEDSNARLEVKRGIDGRVALVSETMQALQQALSGTPQGTALAENLVAKRTAFVESMKEATRRLLETNETVAARQYFLSQTLPLLNQLVQASADIVAFQKQNIEEGKVLAAEIEQSALTTLLEISAVALVLGIAFAILITRGITRPLRTAVETADRLAEGDLTQNIQVDSRDELGQLLTSMQRMVAKLSEIIANVRESAHHLASASEEISSTSQTMAQASSEQAASVEETSASVEQMTASINQNTDNAQVTNSMSAKAAREAVEGGDAVKATVAAMKQIADKIGIIDDIAYQTNLLALNAAIEAARAGDHGKGFAVVAAEVRKLAERSQVAAEEIGEVASSSVELAEKAGRLLDEIVPSIQKTSDLVQEITAASREQSAGVGQINTAMAQLGQLTEQNASSSEELAATAEEMSGQAEQLQEMMEFFRLPQGSVVTPRRTATTTPGMSKPQVAYARQPLSAAPDSSDFVRF